jgi:hypothetical protein
MLKKFILNSFSISIFSLNLLANEDANKFITAYPNFIKEYSNNYLVWLDGEKMIFDDKIENKSFNEKFEKPSLTDQLSIKYIKVSQNKIYIPSLDEDSGRVRFEPFFKKMYGLTQNEVKKNLVKITWLPNSSKKTLWVSKINDVDKKLIAISDEIEKLPKEIKSYAINPDGAYNFRKIASSDRLSAHSFGIAIDLNIKNSNYWLWDSSKKRAEYKNKIPLEIVEIFEKYGFIWGGRWYHYDTMHFEYRPELLN